VRRALARGLPAPWLSLALFVAWPLLSLSASVGNLLLAGVFALVIPWFTVRFREHRVRPRAFGTALRLAGTVLKDIVVSNIDVARRVLGPEDVLRSGFVWVPLTIRDPVGIASFAGIITMTPGTLSSEITPDRRFLLVHALHVEDEAALVADMKARYEAPLIEILEGRSVT
jgi:multicomponent K+:H+ antiporter subunit E